MKIICRNYIVMFPFNFRNIQGTYDYDTLLNSKSHKKYLNVNLNLNSLLVTRQIQIQIQIQIFYCFTSIMYGGLLVPFRLFVTSFAAK